jgi:methylated-DNA-[protein]-cysteine S-methyltransferase
MKSNGFFYTLFPSDFGIFGIIWQQISGGPRVHRIFLPSEISRLKKLIHLTFPHSQPYSCYFIDTLGKKIYDYFRGILTTFDLQYLALDCCSPFQKRVLLAEHQVPMGWVTTYGRIAAYLQNPRGARAVGWALSHNPFPIVIPCHRTIKSSGDIGGFGGEFPGSSDGRRLKQVLLRLEGVSVSPRGKVVTSNIYY